MKKIFKYSLLMLSVVAAFVACKDEDNSAPGEWDANPNYANIYFEKTSSSVELDPSEATTATIAINRRDTVGARTVHMDIAENTDGVFTVSDAVFEDGDSVAYITVNFPNAEVGKTYTLCLSSSDPNLVSSYSKDATYTLNVTRIKWNLVGKATLEEYFVFGGQGQFDLYVRDDDPTKFRFDDMFEEIAANTATELDGNQTKQAFVSILKNGDVLGSTTVSQANLIGFVEDLNTGFVHPSYGADILICHPYGFSSTKDEASWTHNRVLGYQENGLPTQIQIAPFYYMNGVGGWNHSQDDGYVIITFPGYVAETPAYEAQFEDDFEWADVKTFDFTNTLTGESHNVMLQKATCKVDTDDCDSVFMAKYGVPYRVKDAFAEGYDLMFFVRGKKVYTPTDFFEAQPTGVTADPTGLDVYAFVNDDSSIEFNGEDISSVNLNVTFTDKDGNKFRSGTMTLANITWSKIATGTFYYNFFSSNEDGSPEADPGYNLLKRDDKDDQFQIGEWLLGTDGFYFSWDKTTNACHVADQSTYYEHPSYGMIYIVEGAEYHSNYAEQTSYYDPETKTFHFFPAYYVSQGSFGQFEEVFEITEEGAIKRKASFRLGQDELNTSIKRVRVWKNFGKPSGRRVAQQKNNFYAAFSKDAVRK